MNKTTGSKLKRNYTRPELSEKIITKVQSLEAALKSLNAAKVQELVASLSIPISKEYDEVVPGWLGAPKGLLQVSWEQGLIPGDGCNN